MGQKTHPIGVRLGIVKDWHSRWFANRDFASLLQEDLMLRRYITSRLQRASVAQIDIERAPKRVTISIHTARPGIVIGRKGAEVDKLRDELKHLTGKEIYININEIKRPELNAQLVADNISRQLEQRVSFRRAMKKAVASAVRMGAEGIKVVCGGRLGGAEMSRVEKSEPAGRVPLHTLRADIDYARSTAYTTSGTVGVKVWICHGEKMGQDAHLAT
ncbi:MAG: 30S ribosomal protein S3 [Candidatus Latescibacteria bacterium]|nr:30S ribosomal protein S3 [Candidatus Latescibacterota bacterium]